MMGEWRQTTLGELCNGPGAGIQTGPFGSQLHRSDYVASGVPVIMPTNIRDGRILLDGISFIDDADAARLKRHRVRPGDIVFSRRGEVDKCAVVTEREAGWLCGTGCLLGRLDLDRADPRYVGYHISLNETRAWLRQHAVGLVMPNLNTDILGRIPIGAPDIDSQRTVAAVIGAFDDKIALNRQTDETLEASARALFRDWFVDFGPTRAKADGRPAYLAPDLWSLFPARLDDDGMPEGWTRGIVRDHLELRYGKSLPARDRTEGKFPVYGSGGQSGTHDKAIVPGPTVIVGRKGTVGSLFWEDEDCYPIDTAFHVAPTQSLAFAFELLASHPLQDMNTDAAVPGLNRENVYRLDAVTPPAALVLAFDRIAMDLRAEIGAGKRHSRTLAETRDMLLPKLMSGAIRVRDAQSVAGAHL